MYCYANLRFLNRVEAEDAGQSLAKWIVEHAEEMLPAEQHLSSELQQLASMDAASVIAKVKAHELGELLDKMSVQ